MVRRALLLLLSLGVVVFLGMTLVARVAQGTELAAAEAAVAGADPNGALPAAAAAVAPTTAAVTHSVTHTVQPGETLFRIARQHDVALNDLAAANGIVDPNVLYAGDVLTLPGRAVDGGETAVVPTVEPAKSAVAQSHTSPASVSINEVSATSIVVMPAAVKQNARAIFVRGQALGRNGRAYAKVGDSTTENPFFMARFDEGAYNLGDYAYLQGAIDHFAGSHARDSVAVRVGFHAWTAFDPLWSDKARCLPEEGPVPCEIRLHNPSVVLIRLGANDVGAPRLYEESLRQIVEYAIDNGVVPVLGTKPDRGEGDNSNNDIVRRLAAEYQIPLWDYDVLAGTLPNRGLGDDHVHMTTFYAHDYTRPEALQRGHSVHNLSALILLDTLWKDVILAAAD